MLDGTETGIYSYDDTDGNLDFVVATQSDNNFTTALLNKLNAIEASATADQTAAEIRTLVDSASDSNVFTDDDHSKLDGIEASATADQTNAEIRTAVEAATDSNVFTDADHTKLNAIEASADVTDTTNVTAAGALMDSEVSNLSFVKGLTKGIGNGNVLTANDAVADNDFLRIDGTEVEGRSAAEVRSDLNVEDGATADQTASEIKTLVGNASDSNVFTDADHSKLDGIEASADVTDATNVTAAGALMDSELTSIADVKALDQSVISGASPTFGTANMTDASNKRFMTDAQETKLDSVESNATADQTDEEIQDIVGAMLTGNTETGITVTYQDGDGTIDFVVGTLNQDTTGSAATLTTARNIGGVSFDGSADINLPGVNTAGNQNTSGTAANATLAATVTVADSTANTNFPVVFHNESNALLDDTGALRYNPSTGTLLVPNLSVSGTTTTVDTVTMQAANAIIFEGATADANETTLSIIDPTGDRTINLPNVSGTIPVLAAASTTQITSTPEELNILDGKSFLDEDDFSSDSATGIASQQSIKAYVDNEITAAGAGDITAVTFQTDSGSGSKASDTGGSADFLLLGGNGLGITNSGTTITAAIDASQTAITSVLNTSLVLGRDADNQIKFGTDDQIIFEVAGGDNVIFKASGEIEASSLDISGNVDIDGTLETDALTINGTTSVAFTTSDHSKLDGIEASADVTDTSNVTSAGALMDSELTNLAAVKGINQALTTSSDVTFNKVISSTIDVAGDLTLDADGADVILKDGGTEYGRLSQVLGGLTLKSGSSSANAVIFSSDGNTAIFGGGIQLSGSMTLDSVAVSAIQTSSESFADNNTSLMTSAAINDRIESFGYTTNTGDITGVTAGNALTGGGSSGGITINHEDTSSQSSVNNSGRTYIQDITLDTYGHVTGISSATETVTNTDTNTNQLTTFQLEDGDGTEVTVSHAKEVKFVEGGRIDINWTDTSNGTDGDPYDLTFTVDNDLSNYDNSSSGFLTAHPNISAASTSNNSGRTYIQDITLDSNGHVTGIATATETVTNTDTNTNQLTTFQVEDGDGTEVTISHGKEWKFVEGESIDINWTDTSNGSDADPYDLTFALKTAGVGAGTYGSTANGTKIDTITVDAYGRVTAVATGATGSTSTSGTVTSVATGGGLTGGTITSSGTISHADTSSQSSVNNSGSTFIQDITLDTYGHVTAITSASASGFNATTLDGIDSSSFLRSDATDTASGVITFSNTTNSTSKTTGAVKISGGLGVAKTLNAGEDVVAYASSDKRLKDNLKPIENSLDKVSKLSGYEFDWNDKQETYQGHDIGVVAQEVEEVLPEIVTTRDNGYKAVKYEKLVPLLIESIKELKAEIEELKK